MKVLFYLIVLYFHFNLFGQDELGQRYFFTQETLLKLKEDSNYALASWNLSYIGRYKLALEIADYDGLTYRDLSEEQILYFNKFKPVDAVQHITKRAKSERIVMINEAHHQPIHRIFTARLLKGLYNQGFRYFGVETISAWDTTLNLRKYPSLRTGYYTVEPFYGDLVRQAMQVGYKVFAYESSGEKEDSAGINFREIGQAKNIQKVLLKDSNAKILIHCGYDHIIEDEVPGWGKAMAGRVTEFTGLNPFTIDQVNMTERSSMKYENPFFKLTKVNYSAVFIDSLGNPFHGLNENKDYDIRVYHPRTKWIHSRPDWNFSEQRRPYYLSPQDSMLFPQLIFAYLCDEKSRDNGSFFSSPVPYDIIEVENPMDKKPLSLEKGNFIVIIRDVRGKERCLKIKN